MSKEDANFKLFFLSQKRKKLILQNSLKELRRINLSVSLLSIMNHYISYLFTHNTVLLIHIQMISRIFAVVFLNRVAEK